jgi:predicted acylesterase/phospholipase RssA
MPNGAVTALVVSGGGAKGAFAVGAIDHLIDILNVRFGMVAGTSTGSLIAPYVAAGDDDYLDHDYLTLKTEHFVWRRNGISLFTHKALNDTAPFRQVLREFMTAARVARILNHTAVDFITTIIATVSLQSGRIYYFHTGAPGSITPPDPNSEVARIADRDQLLRVMEASSAMPVFMRPVDIARVRAHPRGYRERGDGRIRDTAWP